METLPIDMQVLFDARDERFEAAGLLPRRNPRRSSMEIMRDVRRRREQERSAA